MKKGTFFNSIKSKKNHNWKGLCTGITLITASLAATSAFCADEKLHDVFYLGASQDSTFGTYTFGGAKLALDSESSVDVRSVYYATLLPGTLLATNITSGKGASPRATPLEVDLYYTRNFLDNAFKASVGVVSVAGSFFSAPFAGTPSLVDGFGPAVKLAYDHEMFEVDADFRYALAMTAATGSINQNVLIYTINAGYKISSRFILGAITERARGFVTNLPGLTMADYYVTYGGYFNIKMSNAMSMKFEAANNGAVGSNNQFYKGTIVIPFMI